MITVFFDSGVDARFVTLAKNDISDLMAGHGRAPFNPIPNGGESEVATMKYNGRGASVDCISNDRSGLDVVGDAAGDSEVGGGVAMLIFTYCLYIT